MKVNRKVLATSLTAAGFALTLVLSNSVGVAEAGNNHGKHGNHEAPTQNRGKLKTLGDDCNKSRLRDHNGFQSADPRCVGIEFGEQSSQNNNPSLLIVESPATVGVGQPIVLKVSTQNLVRDRFLAAADGGYYKESAFLNRQGLTRGHFHSSCRLVDASNGAPEPLRQPVFLATEDGGGNAEPDTVTVTLSAGLPAAGTAQCAVWAGDGSHRIPMMAFANQIPAFDAVRITVQ